ncbi:hypothetical protein KVT40_006372 [Elsinoe batatas]|uniref:Uncharacterized protein n=1 Tax=Elsinoe batatas TaxID=2601811 RepID=A0A8K0L1K3_9PEZI|nr:hypothetical protein KVT40_006372 [Elsinoe batatas]
MCQAILHCFTKCSHTSSRVLPCETAQKEGKPCRERRMAIPKDKEWPGSVKWFVARCPACTTAKTEARAARKAGQGGQDGMGSAAKGGDWGKRRAEEEGEVASEYKKSRIEGGTE